MTSQPGLQTHYIYCRKGNQTIKFDQFIEYNKRNIFLQKLCRIYSRDAIVPEIFSFSEKALREIKLVCSLVFVYFNSLQHGIH